MKPYYQNELTTIYNGDCLDVMDYLDSINTKADIVCIDPDYAVTKRGSGGSLGGMMQKKEVLSGSLFVGKEQIDIKDWLPKLKKIIKKDCQLYIFTNDKNLNYYTNVLLENNFKIYKNLIWVKDNKITNMYYMGQKEYIIFCRLETAKPINDFGTSDVLFFPNYKDKDYSGENYNDTQKPLELLETLIKNSSKENDLMLDIMMGTGTAIIGAERNNRRSIGIDLRESQCKRTVERLNSLQLKFDL